MSFILGQLTLPNPLDFTRDIIETQRLNLLLNATTTRNFINRKERFTLRFHHLTRTIVNSILAEFELNAVRDFSVSEPNMTISSTRVLIEIEGREYVTKGPEFRENLKLILTEII